MRNKKAVSIHVYMLVIAFFLGLVAFFVQLYTESKEIDNYIGQYQIQIQKSANEADKALFYIQKSAELAFRSSISGLAQKGGVSEIEQHQDDHAYYECGKFNDAFIWFEITQSESKINVKDCFSEELISANMENEFNNNLNQYISMHPRGLPEDNFDLTFTDTTIIGKARTPIRVEILKEDSDYSDETSKINEKDADKIVFTSPKPIQGLVDFSTASFCKKGQACILREEAYKLLEKAQQNAVSKGLWLEVTSSYRSKEQQIDIWEGRTGSRYKQRYPDESIRRKYVCYPYGDIQNCPHLTGSAVDIRLKGTEMGARQWQQLEDIMTDSGWVRYSKEPWHFECCGTRRYARAKAAGVDVIT